MMEIPKMLTIDQAAKETGLSKHYIRQLCVTRQIVFVKAGKKYLINLSKLVDFFNGDTTSTTLPDGENKIMRIEVK